MKHHTWIAVVVLAFIAPPAFHAQQPADSSSPASASLTSPSRAGTNVPPPLAGRDLAVERAKILMAEKRYEAAIGAYEDLLNSEPKSAVYMNMIGIAYLNMNDFNQAKKYFTRSVKADKKYSSAINNLGMVAYQQKNYRRAIREYQRAIAIAPGQAGTYANLGYAYYKTKKYVEAAAQFRQALQIDPHAFDRSERVGTMVQDRTVENHGLFFFMMAKEYAQLGDAEHCANYLRKSFDEGYKDVVTAKTDPAFKKVVNDPLVQDVLTLIVPSEQKPVSDQPKV
jgi:tetratricopeptide (TPR) repeat protein